MTDLPTLFAANLAAVAAMMLVLWLISIALDDVSFIDSFWAFGFLLIGCLTSRLLPFGGAHQTVLLVLVAVWGLRLGLYLLWRWRREGADGRYVAMKKKATGNVHLYTLKTVFLLQGALADWFSFGDGGRGKGLWQMRVRRGIPVAEIDSVDDAGQSIALDGENLFEAAAEFGPRDLVGVRGADRRDDIGKDDARLEQI